MVIRKLEIMDVTTVCQSFPDTNIKSTIIRDNILNTIDKIYESDIQVVGVEGEEGIGKTTILQQYSIFRHPGFIVSLFIKRTTRWGYDPDTLRFDLCNQISWIVNKKLIEEVADASESTLRNLIMKLQRMSKLERRHFYFVIDGLDEIPDEASHIKDLVLEMLPLGLPGFRFLFSGDPGLLLSKYRDITFKSCPLSGFVLEETRNFFRGFDISDEEVEDIHKVCRFIPGRLASIKRILLTGVDVRDLLNNMHDKLSDLFEMEWKNVSDENKLVKMLAILAHDQKPQSITRLANLVDGAEAEALELLNDLSFIACSENQVSYVSESFRKFAAEKLKHLKKEVSEDIINYLLKDPEADDAITQLPGYLEQNARYEDLLDYLSPTRFADMIKLTQSLTLVQQKAGLGVHTALDLGRDADLLRFSIQKSAIIQMDEADTWRSEIEARVSLGEYESAMALAQSTVLREERLHLLSVIARKKKEQALVPEEELIELINNIYKQIDPEELGDKAIEIASDLIYVCPELAIELVEKATNAGTGENSVDWAFARLSLAALNSSPKQSEYLNVVDNITNRIKNPAAHKLTKGISILVSDYTAADIISEVEKFGGASDRLLLIRQWLHINKHRKDTVEIMSYALNLLVKTSEYAPNALVLREIAIPLPYVDDFKKAKELIIIFDSQREAIEHLGPTEEFIRLQLLLAKTESIFDFSAAADRVMDIYFRVCEIEDESLRAECMSWIISSLEEIDPEKKLESKEAIHSLALEELNQDINTLLFSTAYHNHTIDGIIHPLAKSKPDMIFKLISQINTEYRRDKAYFSLIQYMVDQQLDSLDFDIIKSGCLSIINFEIKDDIVLKIIENLSSSNMETNEKMAKLKPFLDDLISIVNLSQRSKAICLVLNVINKHRLERSDNSYNNLEDSLYKLLEESWNSIDIGWIKVNTGFKIVSLLAEISIDIAKNYLDRTEAFKQEILIYSKSTALSYFYSLLLSVRAFNGLIKNGMHNGNDISRLSDLIDRLPATAMKIELWSELALRFYLNDSVTDCKKIVNENIRPLLDNLNKTDRALHNNVVVSIAPPLYCAHSLICFETLDRISYPHRDDAYFTICEFVLCNKIPSDPYEPKFNQSYEINHEKVLEICEILKRIESDYHIYSVIKTVCDSIVRNKKLFTGQQIPDIKDRLKAIIEHKLPNERFIKHEGYKISSLAQVYRLEKNDKWQELIDEARKIPNIADRAFVLSAIAAAMPTTKKRVQCVELIKETKDIIDKIPCLFDRLEHYEVLVSDCWEIDSALCKKYLQQAMKCSCQLERDDIYEAQRNIIDLAHKLDSELASSLASLIDDDEARKHMKHKIKKQLEILNLKKSMALSMDKKIKNVNTFTPIDYSKAAWKLLGALNSLRIDPIHISDTREYVKAASTLPLRDAYPILSWTIENAVRRLGISKDAKLKIRPIFESILLGVELSARMAERSNAVSNRTKKTIDSSKNSGCLVFINAGERPRATHFIKEWLSENLNDYVKICDPYFGLSELEWVRIIRSINPNCIVQVLTSKKHQVKEEIAEPWNEAYKQYWNLYISGQDPPETDIVIFGVLPSGEPPIHDRWILTKGAGIRIGTSLNSLGVNKSSEISVLTPIEAQALEKEIDIYLMRIKREHSGKKIQYNVFNL